ncbi:MAG: ComEC/Rec2 family competence protein [Clostridia bacterium]|nr:ComEC/Rec2 family competence protein [Clostridia bacterium]
MKKLVNIRLAVVAAFGFGIGAYLGFACCYYSLTYAWTIALVPVTAAILIIFIIKGKTRYIALTAITAALFVTGFFGVAFQIEDFSDKMLESNNSYTITGVVAEKGYTDDGEYIKLKDVTADGEEADGRMYVYLDSEYGEYCDIGYTVTFTGTVYHSQAYAYGVVSSTRLIENLRYTVYPEDELSSEYGYSFFGSINIKVRELIFGSMDGDVAAVAYGMLTGNTEYVDTGTMEYFQYGGVAHVFAVSGLHIGLVFAAVTYLLKKLRVNKYLSAVLSVVFIFFYAGVCGFTLSSVRAAVMCTVLLAVRLSGGKYDSLSALAIAFIAIMLVNPLNLLSAGFQLSVSAVAGIATLSRIIERALVKIKIPQKAASLVSVSLSAQLGTFPILLSCFGYVSYATLLMNIIFVPVLSSLFTLLFVFTVLSLIIQPLAQFFLVIPSAPLSFLLSLLVRIKAENVLISGFEFGWFIAPYYAVVLLLSDKVNLASKVKAVLFPLGVALVSLGVFLSAYTPSGSLKITATAWYGDSSAVLFQTDNSSVLVICQTPSSYDISILLRQNGVNEPDAIIILGDEDSVLAYNTCGKTCGDIYVYYTNPAIQPFTGATVHYAQSFYIDGVKYTFFDYGNLLAEYGGMSVGVCMYEDPAFFFCDLLISETYTEAVFTHRTIYFRDVNDYDNIYDLGDLQFVIRNGKLYG